MGNFRSDSRGGFGGSGGRFWGGRSEGRGGFRGKNFKRGGGDK